MMYIFGSIKDENLPRLKEKLSVSHFLLDL